MRHQLRRLYYRLWPPPEDPRLIGRRVRRGARINGVWKYNQGEGVIVGSEVCGDRRYYRIQFADHVSVCPLPDEEFEVLDETVPFVANTDLPETYRTALGWYQPGTAYSLCQRLIPGTPSWWRYRVWPSLRAAYYRRWPPPELHIGRQVRTTRRVIRRIPPGAVGVVTSSKVSGDRRMYTVEFSDYGSAQTPLPSPKFEFID